MTRRLITSTLAALLGVTGLAVAQDAPTTSWGAPDLQGVWDFRTITPLQRPEDLGDKAFLTAEEAAEREQAAIDRNIAAWERDARRTEAGGNVGGYNNFWMDNGTRVMNRTSLIIDPPNGRLPERTASADERQANSPGSFVVEFPESYTDLSTYDRCLLGFNAGPPITPAAYNQNVQIFQTEEHVALMTEMVHTVRIIPIDGQPHLTDAVQQLSGDSRGRWEGDTLVVETKNFDPARGWRVTTADMTLVERFRRVSDGELEYEFTVNAPQTWEAPWTANLLMVKNELPMFEYACHEGNYSMPQMLGGARALEAQGAGQ